MIYTASYFTPEHHHGLKISISRSEPKNIVVLGYLNMFAPSLALLNQWKKGMSEQEYIDIYREEMRRKWYHIDFWLTRLKPEEDQTLLCWEKKGQFCHRNLVIKFVEKYRPDCYGGMDIPR